MVHPGDRGGDLLQEWGLRPDLLGGVWHRDSLTASGPVHRLESVFSGEVWRRMLAWGGLRADFLTVLLDGRTVPPRHYSRSVEIAGREFNDILDKEAVLRHIAAGATAVMGSVHQYDETVGLAAQDLSRHFGAEVQAHAFFTPPGCPGLAPHTDGEDNLLLQLEGSKVWSLWATDRISVAGGYPAADELGTPTKVVVLHPGDVLYIPLGWVHAGTTTDRASLHMTFQILPLLARQSLLDLAERVIERRVPLDRLAPAPYVSAPRQKRLEQDVLIALEQALAPDESTQRVDDGAAHEPVPTHEPTSTGP